MSESKQFSTLNQLEMSELPQVSPDDFAKEAFAPQTIRSPWICNLKKWMFHILLVVASIALVAFISSADNSQPLSFEASNLEQGNFPFLVHCPYSYKSKVRPMPLLDEKNGDLRRRRLHSSYSYNVDLLYPERYPGYDWSNTYVVDMQSRKEESTGKVFLYYCGIVTNIGSSCDDEVFEACSIPGPMFDLKVNQHVDIIWINNLNKDIYIPKVCFNIKDPSRLCHLKYKPEANRTETFVDPISHDGGHLIAMTPETWPASTHVHGAQVRPTFDGNPLSWISNSGVRGLGAFSLGDKCYYDAFDQHKSDDNTTIPPEVMVKRIENDEEIVAIHQAKISRYLNIQSPGILFYHDHAMNLTKYNVQNGLTGVYILRDPKVEKEIGVHPLNEKLVMLTREGLKHTENLQSATDVVYRFRFINNKYHRHAAFNFSLVYGNNCETPTSLIPFTIIGTDSSLYHEGLQNQTTFTLGQAERIELLIKFEPNHQSYSICRILTVPMYEHVDQYHTNITILGIKLFSRSQYKYGDLNHRKHINNVKLSVPYTDIKGKDHPIAVRRMKPIIYNVYYDSLSFGGRHDFHSGKTDYPVIGTTEDWYFINCLRLWHPVHVHLINMQVTKVLSLRKLKPDSLCVIYELDYVAAAMQLPRSIYKFDRKTFPNASDPRYINYTYLCTILEVLYNDADFVPLLTQVEPEDVVTNGLNGIDVEKKFDDFDRQLFKSLNISTDGGDGKYVTDQVNQIKPYYKGWKDVVMVDGFKVLVSRIRWTKNNYKGGKDTYFNVPLDQLREYPGFLYHCHILNHEDGGMMRPYMLQLPKDAKLNPETPCNNVTDNSWATKVKCLNQRCSAK